MGADLYIRSVSDKLKKEWEPKFDKACADREIISQKYGKDSVQAQKAQKKVEEAYNAMYAQGYFRDSYNDSNVLWLFGLSWWQDITPMCNKKGFLPVRASEKFLRMLVLREATFEERLKEKMTNKDWLKNNKPSEIEKYFRDSAQELRDFLSLAISLKEPIYASL